MDLGKPTHTLVSCSMPKPLPARNQCTGWFAPVACMWVYGIRFFLLIRHLCFSGAQLGEDPRKNTHTMKTHVSKEFLNEHKWESFWCVRLKNQQTCKFALHN
jgi:hypothetical protein